MSRAPCCYVVGLVHGAHATDAEHLDDVVPGPERLADREGSGPPIATKSRRGVVTSALSWSTRPVADPGPRLVELTARSEAGDAVAKDALFTALYAELHRLAEIQIYRNGGNLTLGATTLLHEAYLDIARRETLAFPDRGRFLAYAARAMRALIIDYIRSRGARKRGGDLTFTTLPGELNSSDSSVDYDRLSQALDELSHLEPSLAELVDLKFFCGFSFAEIAEIRHVSERTVQRDWAKARAVLFQAMTDGDR